MQARGGTRSKGFTLVEVIIIIVVIAILALITVVAYRGIQNEAKIAKVQAELSSIKEAMLMYKGRKGELPPEGDFSTIDWVNDTPVLADWQQVLTAMVAAGSITQPVADDMTLDPWGYPYAYDDNDCNAVYDYDAYGNPNPYPTWLRSAGPDGKVYTADDVEILVTEKC